jgi:hypothetical protein
MDIKRIGSQPSGKAPVENFTGTVRVGSVPDSRAPVRCAEGVPGDSERVAGVIGVVYQQRRVHDAFAPDGDAALLRDQTLYSD